jgi:dTDP-4-amino-4,6-dideoxygalactose transaminase
VKRYAIPFNLPSRGAADLQHVAAALASDHLSGDGPYTRRVERLLAELLGVPRVLLTTSCTHALEMAALLLDLAPGDEVIVPAFTFVSTVNAFVLRGARPVFADIRPDTLNLDESRLERLVTPRTRAIALVHYAGVGCAMDAVLEVARRHGLAVVEDAAHGLFGRYRGRLLGTLGDLATLSFHETKNLSCGEGGALVVNDPRRVERAEILREKGTDRSRFFRGQVDKYTWVDVGSSYVMSDLLAALLWAQLEDRERIQARRRQLWARYAEDLAPWAAARGIRLPTVPPGLEHPGHLFYLLLPTLADRQAFMAHLAAADILAVFHYQPLHLSAMGRRLGGRPGDCPVTEDVSDRLVRLPFYTGLTDVDQARVVEVVRRFGG